MNGNQSDGCSQFFFYLILWNITAFYLRGRNIICELARFITTLPPFGWILVQSHSQTKLWIIYLCLLLDLFYDFSGNRRFREQKWQLSNFVNDFGNSNFFTAVHFHFHGCHYFCECQLYTQPSLAGVWADLGNKTQVESVQLEKALVWI